jgi:RHS repeat-associated protein
MAKAAKYEHDPDQTHREPLHQPVKTGTTLLALGYSHCSTYSEPCTNNNGNVWQQTMARPAGSWTQDYGYTDGLNRLNSVAETGPGTGWLEKYGYDAFGNRWVSSTTEQTLTAETPTGASWYLSNNRISGWGYDSAGNITSVSSMQRTFTYDAENRQTSATINSASATYGYDGQGQRVTKTAGGVTTVYVYDAQGDLVEEIGGTNSDTGPLYLTVDALGSTRLVTDGNGAQHLCYDYLPFGQEIPAGTDGRPSNCFTTDTLDTKFTGQKRDSETGLDYFGARYFSGAQGRFGGADGPFNDQDPSDPQSWNLFSYGRNNPLVNFDPTGTACVHSTDAIGQNILFDDGKGCKELTDSGNAATVLGQAVSSVPYIWVAPRTTELEPPTKRPFSIQFLPAGARVCSANENYFFAPPSFDISKIEAAGRAGGLNPVKMNASVGHYGTFDFQRSRDNAGKTTFYAGFTPVSNFAVGVYEQSAGFNRFAASTIANVFAFWKSSNFGDPAQARYRNLGYEAAAKGQTPTCSPN